MLNRMRHNEDGFTLIELLVVILIIGILAAIALPSFLGQQAKGQDSSAKSDARNLVSQMESCYTDTQDYDQCKNTDLASKTGLNLSAADSATPAAGEVSVKATAGSTGYTVEAMSQSGNLFRIVKSASGYARSCVVGSGDAGGCTSSWGTVS